MIMQSFLFTKNIRQGFKQFVCELGGINSLVCLDFEDSLVMESAESKQAYKNHILSTLVELYKKEKEIPIGIRINPVSSIDYETDLEFLRTTRKRFRVIFIPKIESSNDLIHSLGHLSKFTRELIPIIETRQGMQNANEIFMLQTPFIQKIAFGHCDYNLSIGQFPFYHQDTAEYWQWIQYLNQLAVLYNKALINSPVLELNNKDALLYTLRQGSQYNSVKGQITLNKFQSQITSSFSRDKIQFLDNPKMHSIKLQSKDEVLKKFSQFKIEGKSYAIDEKDRLISPQEYRLANELKNEL